MVLNVFNLLAQCLSQPETIISQMRCKMSRLNEAELITKMARSIERGTKKNAKLYLRAFLAVVGDELAKGNEINIQGFGRFYSFDFTARDGKDPRTQEEIAVAAKKIPKFAAGDTLKRKVNS